MNGAKRRNIAMLSLVCLLTLLLLFQLTELVRPNWEGRQNNPVRSPALLAEHLVPALTSDTALYQVIKSRPVFSASRRPAAIPSTTAPSLRISITLVGIIYGARQSIAIARAPDDSNLVLLKHGTNIQGSIVTDIERDHVILQTGHMEQILVIQQRVND